MNGFWAKFYDDDVRSFQPGGRMTLEIVQSGAHGDIGFWTGFQDAQAKLEGKDKLVPMPTAHHRALSSPGG